MNAGPCLQTDWLQPDWPAPASVKALCTTRSGGCSTGPYAGLNLGTHVGDDLVHVQSNRDILADKLGVAPVFLEQVHGTDVAALLPDTPQGLRADAAVTSRRGLACTVMVADCLPVLLCRTDGRAVAAAHAGWRGLLGSAGKGVLEQVCARLQMEDTGTLAARVRLREGGADRLYGNREATLIAWLGPCIGPGAFEVGNEVRDAFLADTVAGPVVTEPDDRGAGGTLQTDAVAAQFVALGGGKWLADLPALARLRLRALGVEQIYGNDGGSAWCTVSNPSRFFSHRRDRVSGRMAACIWLGT